MAIYEKKEWENRVSQYPNRFTLTDADGDTSVITLERNNGEVSKDGDPFNETTMNDLEDRIEDGFDKISSLTSLTLTAGDDTLEFTDESITTNSIIDPYYWVEDDSEIEPVSYKTIKVETGKVTMTFDTLEYDLTVGIRLL